MDVLANDKRNKRGHVCQYGKPQEKVWPRVNFLYIVIRQRQATTGNNRAGYVESIESTPIEDTLAAIELTKQKYLSTLSQEVVERKQ